MTTHIHPTAVIDPSAELGEDVTVGPFAVIGPKVVIGDRTRLLPHCHIVSTTTIGRDCVINTSAVVGGDPQDRKYKGEKTDLIVGDRNRIGEFATVNRGTATGGGATVIGNDTLIMAYVHVAHDCEIGDGAVITNSTQLAGHVKIEEQAWVSGACLFHHFVTVGAMSFVAPASAVRVDVPPYMLADGFKENTRVRTLNIEGLRRRNVPEASITLLKEAYRAIYRGKKTMEEAVSELSGQSIADDPYVRNLLDHLAASHAGYQNRALERFRTDKTRLIPRE